VGGALRYFHASVERRIVEGRGDLAEAASLVHGLHAVHDYVRLEVVEVGDVVDHRERLTRRHERTANGLRSDLEVLHPRLALICGRRVVGPVGALQLARLLGLELICCVTRFGHRDRHLVLALAFEEATLYGIE
jgi:hypothetical protein